MERLAGIKNKDALFWDYVKGFDVRVSGNVVRKKGLE